MKAERNQDYLLKFGTQLKHVRLAKNMSQDELAEKANISESQVSRIERGVVSPSLSQLVSISKALKVKLKDLFDF